jgi:hypothetical protein
MSGNEAVPPRHSASSKEGTSPWTAFMGSEMSLRPAANDASEAIAIRLYLKSKQAANKFAGVE